MQPRAFTLVEILVVVGVLTILSGLALPMVIRSRDFSRQIACASGLADRLKSVHLYTIDHRDIFPTPLKRGEAAFTWRTTRSNSDVTADNYLLVRESWHVPIALASDMLPPQRVWWCPSDQTTPHISAFWARSRGQDPDRVIPATSYWASAALFVSPIALDPNRPAWGGGLLVTQRLPDVAFPSQKVMLRDTRPLHEPDFRETLDGVGISPFKASDRRNWGLVDGAVRFAPLTSLQTPVIPPGVGDPRPFMREFDLELFKGDLTAHGIRGRDF